MSHRRTVGELLLATQPPLCKIRLRRCSLRYSVFNVQIQKPVARKQKNSVENKPAEDAPAPSANGKTSAPEPKKKPRVAAAAPKKKKAAATKKSPARPAGTTAAKPSVRRPAEPTDDAIRIRAYFIAERRHQLSLPGDSNHDWIEARRQLIEEAGLS